eukprot:scaffold7366_cov254-Pinguiococcus_pyrenoidosus.AAC.29
MLIVRLDAAHEVWLGARDVLQQILQLRPELRAQAQRIDGPAANLAASCWRPGRAARRRLLLGSSELVEALDKGVRAASQEALDLRAKSVAVLLHKVLHGVGHGPGVVADAKLGGSAHVVVHGEAVIHGLRSVQVGPDEALEESMVGASRREALLVQKSQDAFLPSLDQAQGGLVVGKLDVRPADAFFLVLLLLRFEDVAVEEVLQALVRVVDQELLEAIHFEGLEAEDVQKPNEGLGRIVVRYLDHQALLGGRFGRLLDALADHAVHPPDGVLEQALVEELGHRVARLVGKLLLPDHGLPEGERLDDSVFRNAKKLGCGLQGRARLLRHECSVGGADGAILEVEVPEPEHGGGGLENGIHLLVTEAHVPERGEKLVHQVLVEAPISTIPGVALVQVVVVVHVAEQVLALVVSLATLAEDHVEDVKGPLPVVEEGADACSGQREAADHAAFCAGVGCFVAEDDLDELAEATGVVVANRPRIAERFQDRVGHEDLPRHRRHVFHRGDAPGRRVRDPGQVVHDDLRRLRLSCAGLAGNQDGLIARHIRSGGVAHRPVGRIRDGVHVRRKRLRMLASRHLEF